MSWHVYSTSTGEWDWAVHIYLNGTKIYNGDFGNFYIRTNISTYFSASEGDITYIEVNPYC